MIVHSPIVHLSCSVILPQLSSKARPWRLLRGKLGGRVLPVRLFSGNRILFFHNTVKATPRNSLHASCLHNIPSYRPKILGNTASPQFPALRLEKRSFFAANHVTLCSFRRMRTHPININTKAVALRKCNGPGGLMEGLDCMSILSAAMACPTACLREPV